MSEPTLTEKAVEVIQTSIEYSADARFDLRGAELVPAAEAFINLEQLANFFASGALAVVQTTTEGEDDGGEPEQLELIDEGTE